MTAGSTVPATVAASDAEPARLPAPAVVAALDPVRAALLTAARADADRTLAAADASAAATVGAARERADRMITGARRAGEADAAAVIADERAQVRRTARTVVLRARREAYDGLWTAARAAVSCLRDEPGYRAARERLVTYARDRFGPQATIRDADGGGIVAEVPGRRLDLSLPTFAEHAVDTVAIEDLT
jgi:vacuolar-type H+-ATPase subunit E/Vma4